MYCCLPLRRGLREKPFDVQNIINEVYEKIQKFQWGEGALARVAAPATSGTTPRTRGTTLETSVATLEAPGMTNPKLTKPGTTKSASGTNPRAPRTIPEISKTDD